MKTPMLILAAALAAACQPEKGAPQQPKPPKVTVANVEARDLTDYDEYKGYLDAAQTVEVRARVRGHLHKIDFTDGQLVKAGQVLFELDPRPFQADVDRAKAMVTALKAQQDAAEKERKRQESLLGRGGASQSLVDKLTADVVALGAQIAAQQQEVARLELDLEYSRITAAIDGRIGRALLTVGNLVNAGGSDPLLATIVSIDPMYLYFTVDERSLQRYQKSAGQGRKPGDKLSVEFVFGIDTDQGYPRKATLDFGDVKVDPGTGTITVRGTVANPDAQLIGGSRVRIRITTGEPRKGALVPDRAIMADQDRRYVLMVDAKQTVERRDVLLGKLLDDGSREVTPRDPKAPPFKPEDRVIVEGLLRARLHQPVEPVPAK